MLAIALLQGVLVWHESKLAPLYATSAVYFSESLPFETVKETMQAPQDSAKSGTISASFWGQSCESVSTATNRAVQDMVCIGYFGDAADCLPVTYVQGNAPGFLGAECAISNGLAQTLLGSEDVVGLTVQIKGESYRIAGVFSATDYVFLYASRQNFICAELRGVSKDSPKADIERWCRENRLPTPQRIVYRPQHLWIKQLVCWTPMVVTGLFLALVWLRRSFSWGIIQRNVAWFALAVAFAWILPHLLSSLPQWLIPARWSDFSFWGDLADRIKTGLLANAEAAKYWRELHLT